MTGVDRFIQRLRIQKAAAHIPAGARVLDIGCSDGPLFRQVSHIQSGIGVDPLLEGPLQPTASVQLLPGGFPEAVPEGQTFDAITMLAVLEHVPRNSQPVWAAACARFLRPGGRLIITVPSPAVDSILAVLSRLRLIHGMALEQHYGFVPAETVPLFSSAGLSLSARQRFQFGLNNLFVFTR